MKNLLLTFLMISTSLLSQTMHTINAGNYYYSPEALTIEQGDSVEFINDNGFHDVVITSGPEMLTLPACSGPCDIGVLVFNTPGEYEYICSIGSHSSLGMVGTITVNETDQILGCTDPYAENYNPNADEDDGTGYPDNGNYSLNFDKDDNLSKFLMGII